MSKKTLSLILTLLVLTIVLVYVAISANRSKQEEQISKETGAKVALPTEKFEGNTVLSMTQGQAAGSGSARTVNVNINTNGDTITAVQLEIAYNPALLTNMSIKSGTFFDSPIVLPVGGVNPKTGRITFQVTSGTLGAIKSGTGTVAVLTFYPSSQPGVLSTPLTILEKSLVTGRRGTQTIGTSLLKSFSGTTIDLR